MVKERLRVFIAEDDPIVLQGFKAIINEMNYIVAGEATNGKAAVEKVLEVKPDIVIIDVNMPIIDGLTAVELINEKMKIPHIVVTGYKDREILERMSRAGVYGYLPKPIYAYELQSAIEIAMSRFEQVQKLTNELDITQKALEDRKYIEKAKGILIDKFGMQEIQAMKYMQKKSRDKNKKLVDIAKEILRADKLLDL